MTTTAPSMIFVSTTGHSDLLNSRQGSRSEFVVTWSLPIIDNAGGQAWFSCLKKTMFDLELGHTMQSFLCILT